MEHLPNGSILKTEQNEYVVCETYVHEKYDEPHFRYIGYTVPEFENGEYNPEYLLTTAKVTDNKDPDNLGRIQVEFVDFSDNDSEKTWISLTTPYIGSNNGGCVYVPDVNDIVFICITFGKAYALNSIRVNVLPKNCRDVQKKHFAINSTIITIDEDEILAKQGDKSSCIINGDSIIVEHDKSKILLDDNSVTNQMDKSTLVLKSNQIKSEIGKSSIELTSNEIKSENGRGKLSVKNGNLALTGGKSSLTLENGKSKLSGNNIDLSTQGISL